MFPHTSRDFPPPGFALPCASPLVSLARLTVSLVELSLIAVFPTCPSSRPRNFTMSATESNLSIPVFS